MKTWPYKIATFFLGSLFLIELFSKSGWLEWEWVQRKSFKISLVVLNMVFSKWTLFLLTRTRNLRVQLAIWGSLGLTFGVMILARNSLFETPKSVIIGLAGILVVFEIGLYHRISKENRAIEESDEEDA